MTVRYAIALALLASCITREDVESRRMGGVTVWVRGGVGEPLPDARVTVAGAELGLDAAGIGQTPIEEPLVPGAHAVRVTAPDHADGFARVEVIPYADATATVTLPRLRHKLVRWVRNGAAMTEIRRFSVVFGPGALFDPDATDGEDYSVVQKYAFASLGDLGVPAAETVGTLGSVPLRIFAALFLGSREPARITLEGSATFRVHLTDPMRSLVSEAGGVDLYRLDPQVGAWIRQGEGRIEGNSPVADPIDSAISIAADGIDADGWWALGAPFVRQELHCSSGALVDDAGGPVAGAELTARNAGNTGVWRAWTGTDGSFVVGSGTAGTTLTAVGSDPRRRTLFEVGDLVLEPSGDRCPDALGIGTLTVGQYTDEDGDGFFPTSGGEGDCDDADPAIHPAASDQVGDDVDTNCDGLDGIDVDRDGEPSEASGGADCDDRDPEVNPGLPEVCDDKDNDCIDDDGFPPPAGAIDPDSNVECIPCSPQSIADLGPILYWTLDEDSEVSPDGLNTYEIDDSGFGYDGQIRGLLERRRGATSWDTTTPLWPKDIDNEIWVDGIDAWPTTTITASMWLRSDRKFGVPLSYLVKGNEASTSGHVHANTTEFGLVDMFDSLRMVVHQHPKSMGPALPNGEWNHVLAMYDAESDVGSTRIDDEFVPLDDPHFSHQPGVPVDPGSLTMTADGRLYVGQDQDIPPPNGPGLEPLQSYAGLIDEIAVFDRVLSVDEQKLLYEIAICAEQDCVGDRLLGTIESCPAESCQEILDSNLSIGDGDFYWVDKGDESGPHRVRCLFDGDDATDVLCGDRTLIPPYETCEPSLDGPACGVQCAWNTGLPHCAAIRDAGYRVEGAYWLDTDGGELSQDLRVLCTAGGWTRVVYQDLSAGYVFPNTATALSSHPEDPFHPLYSILDRLPMFEDPLNPGYELRLAWPDPPDDVEEGQHTWYQSYTPLDGIPIDPVDPVDPSTCPADLVFDPVVGYCPEVVDLENFVGLVRGDCLGVNALGYRALLLGEPPVGVPTSAPLSYAVGVSALGVDGDARYPLHVPELHGTGTTWRMELWVRPNLDTCTP